MKYRVYQNLTQFATTINADNKEEAIRKAENDTERKLKWEEYEPIADNIFFDAYEAEPNPKNIRLPQEEYQCGSCEKYFTEPKDGECPHCGSGNWVKGCIDEPESITDLLAEAIGYVCDYIHDWECDRPESYYSSDRVALMNDFLVKIETLNDKKLTEAIKPINYDKNNQ